MNDARKLLAATFLSLPISAGCGGTVVFEENGDDGGSSGNVVGPSSTSAGTTAGPVTSSGGDGGADPTSTATASSVTSASTGTPAACLGLLCGDGCVQCNEFKCLGGFCNEVGACVPERACPTPGLHDLCYQPGRKEETCVDVESAPFRLCTDCPSGKGCTFFGEVFDGPYVTPAGECCYEVDGDCAPNP